MEAWITPDTNDAAAVARTAALDLRSPDTRDAALTAQSGTRIVLDKEGTPPVDLRSPDTRDAGLVAHSNGSVVVVAADSQRFDWTDAGIGAAGGFAIALILAGTFVLMRSASRDKLVPLTGASSAGAWATLPQRALRSVFTA